MHLFEAISTHCSSDANNPNTCALWSYTVSRCIPAPPLYELHTFPVSWDMSGCDEMFSIFLVVWFSRICRVSLWFALFREPWIWTFADVPEWRKANVNSELSQRADIWPFIVLGFVCPFICIRVSVYGRFSIWWLVLVLDSFPIVNIIWHLFGATVIWLWICLFCRESAWHVL